VNKLKQFLHERPLLYDFLSDQIEEINEIDERKLFNLGKDIPNAR